MEASLANMNLPEGLNARLLAGQERIRRIRLEISQVARVSQMPPLQLIPCIFTREGGRVHASAPVIPAIGKLGVLVAAGPILCTDERLIRDILVHEFSHCFWTAAQIIDHIDSGRLGPLVLAGNPMDQSREDATHVDLGDWFGEEDRVLLRWGDPRIAPYIERELDAVAECLPTIPAPLALDVRGVIVPPEWAAHIRGM